MKTCSKCGELKPFDEFYRRPDSRNGFRSACKVCQRRTRRSWYDTTGRDRYAANAEAIREIARQRQARINTPTRISWQAMRQRCRDPNRAKWHLYGGRGITVCERWDSSYEAFIEDMGERPEGMTLDRIDNDAGYWCGHCAECERLGHPPNTRWATAKEQRANQRKKVAA